MVEIRRLWDAVATINSIGNNYWSNSFISILLSVSIPIHDWFNLKLDSDDYNDDA